MKEKRSTSYKIRLKDSELLRWKAAAKDANLPLSVYIRLRIEGKPVLPPKVPAVNARVSVQMGNFDVQLRRVGNNLNQAVKAANTTLEIDSSLDKANVLELKKNVGEVSEVLNQVRDLLRSMILQLSGAEENDDFIEDDEPDDSGEDYSDEDWD
jgi:hypothetical protein